MTLTDSDLTPFLGHVVVLDLTSTYVISGVLAGTAPHHLILEQADVHDLRDTSTTRELYVLEVKRLGVTANRRHVWVRAADVVSISKLADVV